MTILVAAGTGFIGSKKVAILRSRGNEVVAGVPQRWNLSNVFMMPKRGSSNSGLIGS
jgi:uncharacterized protein YbjT (DUF2867 family)